VICDLAIEGKPKLRAQAHDLDRQDGLRMMWIYLHADFFTDGLAVATSKFVGRSGSAAGDYSD